MADNFVANAGSGGSTFAADDVGSVLYPRMKVSVGPDGVVADGYTPHKVLSAATTNATSLKAGAGAIGSILAINFNAAARYLKLYNKASAPTVGSDAPVWTVPIPPNGTTGGGVSISIPGGLLFTTGIAYAITAAIGDSDTTAVAANEICVSIAYA